MVPLFCFMHIRFGCAYFILPFSADYRAVNDAFIKKYYRKSVKSVVYIMYIS